MKINFLKYIFVIFAVSIIAFAVYILYIKDTPIIKKEDVKIQKIKENEIITDLRLAISDFDTINPLITNNKEVINIDKLIFDSLISITEDYKVEYNLASECSKISETTYIIKTINNVKWQDGSNFTTKDIEFTINTIKNGQSIYLYNVQNIIGTEIIDENTIKIFLSKPIDFFEYNLTFPILSNNYYINEEFYQSSKIPIGTGAYKIENITDNQIKLKKNNDFWNEQKNNKIETINIKIAKNIGEIYNNFKLRNVDLFVSCNSNIEDYIGIIGYRKEEIKGREFDYLAFNCDNKILKDAEIRKAINYSINKQDIMQNELNDEYFEAKFPLDYGSYLYNKSILELNYNPELAKEILIDNGWKYKNSLWQKNVNNNIQKLNFTLTVNENNESRVKVAENIKKQLSTVGINININKVSENKYKEILKNKNYEIILTGVYNSISPDLNSFFDENNLQNYYNSELLNNLEEVKNIKDENLLKQKYDNILKIYKEEIPFIGLYRNKINILKNDNLICEIKANSHFTYYGINNWYRI